MNLIIERLAEKRTMQFTFEENLFNFSTNLVKVSEFSRVIKYKKMNKPKFKILTMFIIILI